MKRHSYITLSSPAIPNIVNTFLVLVFASLIPIVIHLIPVIQGVPSGARFLPIYYAPFMGIVLFGSRVGITAGLLAPAVNALITGQPDMGIVLMLTVELALFTFISSLLYSRWKHFWGIAPAAYLLSKCISCVVLGIAPGYAGGLEGISLYLWSLGISLPGLVLLLLINIAVVVRNRKTHA